MTKPNRRRVAPRDRRGAFTLIELMVVLAVICILAAMLLPALRRVREVARRSKCSYHLKQWHGVLQFYADDHRGHLPSHDPSRTHLSCLGYDTATGFKLSEELMEDYKLPRDVWFCPSDIIATYGQGSVHGYDYYWDPKYHPYGRVSSYLILMGTDPKRETSSRDRYYVGTDRDTPNLETARPDEVLMADRLRHGTAQGWQCCNHVAYDPLGVNRLHADGSVLWRSYPQCKLQYAAVHYSWAGLLEWYW